MEDKTTEYKAEIDRLKLLLAAAEKKNKVRTARIEFVGEGNQLGMVVTAPNTLDEMEFAKFIASQVAMLVNAAVGAAAMKTVDCTATPRETE